MTISRRNFLLKSSLASAGALFIGPQIKAAEFYTHGTSDLNVVDNETKIMAPPQKFVQAPLPYAFDALEPVIDAKTMEIHYTKHHAGYVRKLNDAVANDADFPNDLKEVFSKIKKYDDTIRNNAGGHWNHEFFWQSMQSPSMAGTPSASLMNAMTSELGGFENFKKSFTDAATERFGSGWAWLILNKKGQLEILSTPNQDNPWMCKGQTPLLGLDVWEHAYYLKYQNKRAEYIENFFKVINWGIVETRYNEALTKK